MTIFKTVKSFISANILSLLILQSSSAQDIHFSEFFASPLLVNPAKTGFITDDYRISGIYRNQWASVTTPYKTVSGSADISRALGKDRRNIIGTGLIFFNDRAGDSRLSNTSAALSFAYHKSIDKFQQQYLGAGVSVAYVFSNIDYNGLHWDEQYKGGMLTEVLPVSSGSYIDLSAGLEYNFLYSKNQNLNLGFAVYHLNNPVNTFFGDAGSRIHPKYVFNGGVSIPIRSKFSAFPKIYFTKQDVYLETIFGTLVRYNINTGPKNDYGVYLGSFLRWNDALLFTTRLDLNNLALGFSYDVNFSRLAEASYSLGGPELSILYTGNIAAIHNKKIYCPRF